MIKLISGTGPLAVLIATSLLVGCSDDYILDFGSEQPSNIIRFGIASPDRGDAASTRSGLTLGHPSEIIPCKGSLNGHRLYVHSEVSDYQSPSATRGETASMSDGAFMYDELEMAAYYYTDSESWEDYVRTAPNFFCDETAAAQGGTTYGFATPRYWPSKGKMRFMGYAPSIAESTNNRSELQDIVPRNYWFDKDYASGPRMYVRVPKNVADQQDLLVAYTSEIACEGTHEPVPVNFQHPLTCVNIECGEDMIDCTIKKISFKNICSDGNFVFDMDDAASPQALTTDDISSYPETSSPKFEIWGNLDTFTLDYGSGMTAGPNTKLTTDKNLFFMLPQKFDSSSWPWSSDAVPTLEIELEHTDKYTGAAVSQTIEAPLDGRVWPAGKKVTYTLTFKDEILEVGEPLAFSYKGLVYNGTTVGSPYDTIAVNSQYCDRFRDWTFEILDGGSSWLNGTKSADGSSLTFNIIDNSNIPTGIDIDANLARNASKGTTAAPWNLSNSSGAKDIQNTANCYMIDAKGSYILPLVYGNAIKNGTANQSAYYYAGGELPTFLNHAGNTIFSPYIQSTWLTPTKAYVVWQDVDGLVSDVTLKANYFEGGSDIGLSGIYGIEFDVAKNTTIRQGNAVIAVEGSDGNVMWSWHIWVTDLDFSATIPTYSSNIEVENSDGVKYDLMPVNLGWCSEGTVSYYPRRSCRVRITSDDLSEVVEVVQEAFLEYPRGNSTYYQWGRKDPFIGTVDGETSKTWYDASGAHASETQLSILEDPDKGADNMTTREALAAMIKNPSKWHIPPYTAPGTISWGGVVDLKDSRDKTYANLWNNSDGTTDVKTIYDPCPAGYMVANPAAFSSLALIDYGGQGGEFSETYSTYDKFQILSFPMSGYRDWADNGRLFNAATNPRGCVWTNMSTPDAVSKSFNGSVGCAYYMNFTGTVMIPKDFFFTCDGFSVRPCVN